MTSRHGNMVSLPGTATADNENHAIADDADDAASDASVVSHQSRRKRQKRDVMNKHESPTATVVAKRTPEDEEKEQGATAAVAPLVSDAEKIARIATQSLWSDQITTVTMALDALYTLLWDKDSDKMRENRSTAVLVGAPLAIVKAMHRNANSPEILADACYALSAIAINHEIARVPQSIIETGGLQACLLAMKRYHYLPSVQAAGCNLIGNLWFRPNARQSVVKAGGLRIIMASMRSNQLDASVQDQACYALYSLLRLESSTWAEVAVDAGGIEAVINAMENHWDQATIQLEGCLFLSAVAKNNQDFRNRIIDEQGLVSIVEARRIHDDNADVLQEAEKAIKAILL